MDLKWGKRVSLESEEYCIGNNLLKLCRQRVFEDQGGSKELFELITTRNGEMFKQFLEE